MSDYSVMKTLPFLMLAPLVFATCTSTEYQEMQNERDKHREAYEDSRRKHYPRAMELDLTEKLLGRWHFLDMEVDEGDLSEEIAALKYKLHATARQNLTLEFFVDRNVFRRYSGKNGDTEVTGSFIISSQRYGDVPFPYLRVFRDTGDPLSQFIFGMSHTRTPGISVTEDRLYLTLYGIMELTPNGWAQSGGIRCSFKRIK